MKSLQRVMGAHACRVWMALFSFVCLASVITGCAASTRGRAAGTSSVRFWLTILHNNDGESQLIDAGSGLEDYGGVARFTTAAKELKREATRGRRGEDGVIMLSSGDNFLAGPEFNASLKKGVPFHDTFALELIGYDAMCLGNHDFDFGPDVLADFIEGYEDAPPHLSANLDFSREPRLRALVDRGVIAASAVIHERGQKIGVIGATTENLPFISSPRNVGVNEVAAAVRGEVDRLQNLGVRKIILLSHLQSLGEDLALAALLRGVDVMVGGGGDELLANPGDSLIPGDEGNVFGPYPLYATDADGKQIPVVTTSGEYRYVGRLAVGFNKKGEVVAIDEEQSGPVRVDRFAFPPDPTVQERVVDPVVAFVDDLASTVIATSEVALDGLRGSVRTGETNEGNLIADALLWQASQLAASFGAPMPDVALQNGGGIRNNTVIAAGDITLLDTFDILPFPNFVTVVPSIPRTQLKEILENAVSQVESASGRFAQISGFTMVWDPAGDPQELDGDGNVIQPGTRIRNVTLTDGTPIVTAGQVVPGAALNVATIDFLARGGDQYPYRGAPFTSLGVSCQQALANYVQQRLGGIVAAGEYPEGGEGRIRKFSLTKIGEYRTGPS